MAHSVDVHLERAAPEQEAARQHYDRWRAAYSRSHLLASLQRTALAELDLRGEDRLLDIACGAGKLLRAAAPRVERAVGVDLSPGMIEEAHKQTDGGSDERIEFVVAPSDRLPFEDAGFTAVVTTTAFHHFPHPLASVREMARVLAPGGRVLIGDAVRDMPAALAADIIMKRVERGHVGLQGRTGLERLLVEAGLQVTRSRSIWLGLYAFVMALKPGRDEASLTSAARTPR